MKQWNNRILLSVSIALGAVGYGLYRMVYIYGVDERGLLVRWHPLSVALWVLAGLVLGLIAIQCLGRKGFSSQVKVGLGEAFGSFLSAACIFLTVLRTEPRMDGFLGTAWQALGYAAAACLLGAGYCHVAGKKPFFALHLAVCLFYLLHIVNHYRVWSGNPQMMDFLPTLLACIALVLYAYYCAAWEVGLGRERMRLGTGLAAVFLCITALGTGEYVFLYGSAAVWAGTTVLLPESTDGQEAADGSA